jgi:hypothetical protein
MNQETEITILLLLASIFFLVLGISVGSIITYENTGIMRYRDCLNYLPSEQCFERHIKNAK